MDKSKIFKDPIYGYISIPYKITSEIIDQPIFQRLRDIVQTSYAPLYSSAVHNRFVHSLGVYYLGSRLSKTIRDEFDKKKTSGSKINLKQIDEMIDVYKLACLLHDVGHAPFSHTGENYYLKQGFRDELHKLLSKLINDPCFLKEIENNSYKAAPHELMSAIIGIRYFGNFIPQKYKSFFARCIIGYKFSKKNIQNSIFNVFIELLNSNIIDVDKLDYLVRDAYMIGFETVSIDYERIINNIAVIQDEEGFYYSGYYKSAVSVIENVVYAHDAERKWIQTHPAVIYEISLIQQNINHVIEERFEDGIIPLEALTEKGISVSLNKKSQLVVRYISDSDFLFFFKMSLDKRYIKEFFNRSMRRHPLWKSESEYRAIFSEHRKDMRFIIEQIEQIKKTFMTIGLGTECEINETSIRRITEELKVFEKQHSNNPKDNSLQSSIKMYKRHLKFMRCFEEYSRKSGNDLDYLLLNARQFRTGFNKKEFENIKIIFPEMQNPCSFGSITSVLKSEEVEEGNFFYIFCYRKEDEISVAELVKSLIKFANEISTEAIDIKVK